MNTVTGTPYIKGCRTFYVWHSISSKTVRNTTVWFATCVWYEHNTTIWYNLNGTGTRQGHFSVQFWSTYLQNRIYSSGI